MNGEHRFAPQSDDETEFELTPELEAQLEEFADLLIEFYFYESESDETDDIE